MTTETRLAGVSDTLDKLQADLGEAEAQAAEAERDFVELSDPASDRAALDRARNAAGEARRREAEARAVIGRLIIRQRCAAIVWSRRGRGAFVAQAR